VTPEEAEEYTQSLGQIGGGLWRQILWATRQGVPRALGLSTRQWVTERLGGYVTLAIEERRDIVKQLAIGGLSQRQIGDVVGASAATINSDLAVQNQTTGTASDPDDVQNRTPDRLDLIQELAAQHSPSPAAAVPPPPGRYACVVIDPPWPITKIVTRHRPWQGVDLDYPTMSLEDIGRLPVRDLTENDAHLYLWVTHRFLPDGLRLAIGWGFKYQCLMTWNKATGVVPFSWMYDTEHVIFATRGNLKVAKRGMRLSFDEPPVRDGHSTKPEVFYDRVRLASPEPRLELFARRQRAGFDAWGNEVPA
jgi:N6-adenosine-specific RNA methylase IME4